MIPPYMQSTERNAHCTVHCMRVLHKSAGPVGNLYLLPAGRCALRLTFSTVQVQSPEVAYYLHYAALVLVLVLVRAPLV
jgi:hypothetical protein